MAAIRTLESGCKHLLGAVKQLVVSEKLLIKMQTPSDLELYVPWHVPGNLEVKCTIVNQCYRRCLVKEKQTTINHQELSLTMIH